MSQPAIGNLTNQFKQFTASMKNMFESDFHEHQPIESPDFNNTQSTFQHRPNIVMSPCEERARMEEETIISD